MFPITPHGISNALPWVPLWYDDPRLKEMIARLKSISREAGVHLYTDGEDLVYANSRYLCVFARGAGRRTAPLPGSRDVFDAVVRRCPGRGVGGGWIWRCWIARRWCCGWSKVMRLCARAGLPSPVRLTSMGDPHHQHDELTLSQFVDDSVVSYAYAAEPRQVSLEHRAGVRVVGESVDPADDWIANRSFEFAKLTSGARLNPYRVNHDGRLPSRARDPWDPGEPPLPASDRRSRRGTPRSPGGRRRPDCGAGARLRRQAGAPVRRAGAQ